MWYKFWNIQRPIKSDFENYPMEIYFLRNGDIPKYLHDGVIDLAIIGENTLYEKITNLRY